ncbi:MAG: cell division protein FtsZ [Candidatus Marivariicella framensis]|jgi:cell division protein FtsZ|tara:strand:- start:3387 stop:5417 length:2031 start_codon:yes stop_codon:yes gene_type:complete
MDQENSTNFSFDLPKNKSNVIKVIGVGGGGSNAINYMFQQGLNGVDFVVCNTDAQALNQSSVPIKIQLGATLTEGLGAGANPEVGAQAAQESYEDLRSLLNAQTKMIFITAGMGGGTGTGAAPIIAKMAKELDILTVGIVTMPFQFEGKLRLDQAQKGLENIKSEVDSLVVINNNKLREVYGNLGFKAGFAKADEVLSKAARGIAEVITHHYTQNIDLKDAKTVLTNSGSAIMGSGTSSGTNRAQEAIVKALDSPLLNDNKITGSKNVLLLIVSGSEEITIDEIGEINDFIQSEAGNNTNIIMGVGEDKNLENAISVTIIATGFDVDQQNQIVNTESKKIIHTLEEDQKMEHILVSTDKKITYHNLENTEDDIEEVEENDSIYDNTNEVSLKILLTDEIRNIDVVFKEIKGNNIQDSDKTNLINENSNSIYENKGIEMFDSFEINNELLNSPPSESYDQEFEGSFIINDLSEDIKSLKIVDEELLDIEKENQTTFDFGIPLSRIQKNEIKAVDSINFILNDFETDQVENSEKIDVPDFVEIKNYDLEKNEMDDDIDKLNDSKEISTSELFNIEVNEPEFIDSNTNNGQTPFDKTIIETASLENKKRMVHLKEFNYSFKNNLSNIDELEKEPAYKRYGLNIDESESSHNLPKIVIETDENDSVKLKSNNSFLHDNVD